MKRLSVGGFIPDWLNLEDPDLRETQAKCLWDKGWGTELGIRTFQQYLFTVPPVPQSLLAHDPLLGRLVLCDPRPKYAVSSRMAGIRHVELGYGESSIVPWDNRHEDGAEPFWLRAHGGWHNRGRKPSDCRRDCIGDLLAGTAQVGIALCAHDPTLMGRRCMMDLPGSVHCLRRQCVYLHVFNEMQLDVHTSDNATPGVGSVVFRRK